MKSASWERSKRTTTWTWKLSWIFPCGNALSSLRLLSCPRYACTHARTHKHARTHIHIHIHMHTHTHTQTHDVSTVLTSRLQLFRSLLSGALALSSAPPTWTVPQLPSLPLLHPPHPPSNAPVPRASSDPFLVRHSGGWRLICLHVPQR